MEQQKRRYLLYVLLIATVLVGGYYNWRQQITPPATAMAPASAVPAAPSAPEVVVYVSGYVVRPGVYKLSGEPRAIDCINAAGGFAAGSNPAAVNLAQKVTDGMQINVPGSLAPAGSTAAAAQAAGKVSLNAADKKQLESLPGIGPALADRILEYRTAKGGFQTVDEMKKVPGIGEAKFNSMKDKLVL